MVSVSMNTRPRISANRIPADAAGFRAIASAAPATALPWPIPQKPTGEAQAQHGAEELHFPRSHA